MSCEFIKNSGSICSGYIKNKVSINTVIKIGAAVFTLLALSTIPGTLGIAGYFSAAPLWMHQITVFLTFPGTISMASIGTVSTLLAIALGGYLLYKCCTKKSELTHNNIPAPESPIDDSEKNEITDGSENPYRTHPHPIGAPITNEKKDFIFDNIRKNLPEGHYQIFHYEDDASWWLFCKDPKPAQLGIRASCKTIQITNYLVEGKPTPTTIAQLLIDEKIQNYSRYDIF